MPHLSDVHAVPVHPPLTEASCVHPHPQSAQHASCFITVYVAQSPQLHPQPQPEQPQSHTLTTEVFMHEEQPQLL